MIKSSFIFFVLRKNWQFTGRFVVTTLIVFLSGCSEQRTVEPVTVSGGTGGWQWQNPFPAGRQLGKVYARGKDTAMIVDYAAGNFYATKDEGRNWSVKQVDGTSNLKNLSFPSSEVGWIVSSSAVYRTTSGGDQWTAGPDLGESYEDVKFASLQRGLICGSRNSMFRTEDGGASWDTIVIRQVFTFDVYLYSIFWLTDSVAWVSGTPGVALRTADAGRTWSRRFWTQGGLLNNIFFVSDSVGFVTELTGIVMKTTDQGWTWRTVHRSPGWLHSIGFIDELRGWTAGENGYIAYTSDGGESWTQVARNTGTWLNGLHITSDHVAWLVGEGGTVLRTDPGQTEWKSLTKGVHKDLYGVNFTDRWSGWVVGESGTIMSTTDGGLNWEPRESGYTGVLFGVATAGPEEIWAVGDSGTILCSGDNGHSWQRQNSGTSAALFRVVFINEKHGWAGGTSGTLLETVDGGNSWQSLGSMGIGSVWTIFPERDGTLWVGGTFFLKTQDRSGNWKDAEGLGGDIDQRQFMHVQFISDNEGWVIENPGLIWSTQDGGRNWSHRYINQLGNYLTGWLTGGGVSWVVGTLYLGGNPPFMEYARKNKDGFTKVQPDHRNAINGIFFIDDRCGWIVGDNGMILHTETAGL